MKNNATRTIRSEEITIDVRICAALAVNRGGEIYLAAIAPDMELTVITLDEAPGILPCFEEDDAYLNLPNTSLLLCYNPAQVLKMGGKHYLTGPVILARTNMDGEESILPGLPQGTERDARTGSCAEKRRTLFCRGKGYHRENSGPINEYRRGLFPFWGDVLGGFFSLYSSGPVL